MTDSKKILPTWRYFNIFVKKIFYIMHVEKLCKVLSLFKRNLKVSNLLNMC